MSTKTIAVESCLKEMKSLNKRDAERMLAVVRENRDNEAWTISDKTNGEDRVLVNDAVIAVSEQIRKQTGSFVWLQPPLDLTWTITAMIH